MLAFPRALKPLSGGYAQNIKSLSGGQSLGGLEQVVSTLNDRWRASFTFSVNSTGSLFALRAFVMSMGGRKGTTSLPVFDRSRAPWPIDQFGRELGPAQMRNRSLDGTPFADPDGFNDTLLTAALAANADLGATVVSVAIPRGRAPTPGQFFSVGARLYCITEVLGSGPYGVSFWPRLRGDVTVGMPVNFSSPTCEMRFASDGEGADALSGMAQMRFGSVTLNFDEAAPVIYSRELRDDGGVELRDGL